MALRGCEAVLIVSALYGLLFPWEWIQDYDLTMKDRDPGNQVVHRLWRDAGLGGALNAWCQRQQIECVIDLLSPDYRKALGGFATLNAEVLTFTYPGRGIGALQDRGDDLRRLLEAKSAGPSRTMRAEDLTTR